MKMVTLRDPASGDEVCVQAPSAITPDALAALGYPGWTVISQSAAMPVETMSAQEITDARLNTLTNAELMAEMKAWAASAFAPKPN